MTMQVSAYGRLGQEPRRINTSTGKAMAVCSMACDVEARGTDDTTVWLGIVAFGDMAEQLLKHSKGEMVSVFGSAKKNSYTTGQGEVREQLQIVADCIASARSSRPGFRRKDAPAPRGRNESAPPHAELPLGNDGSPDNEAPW
jgi:single-strand DNA-binding protein